MADTIMTSVKIMLRGGEMLGMEERIHRWINDLLNFESVLDFQIWDVGKRSILKFRSELARKQLMALLDDLKTAQMIYL